MPRKRNIAPPAGVIRSPATGVDVTPYTAPPVNCTVTNCIGGTRLHLGDGRVLAFEESAEVSEGLATFLRDREQVL